MKIRMNGKVMEKTNEEIIQLLKQGIQFHLLFEGGEALVSATIPKKPSLSDEIYSDGNIHAAKVKKTVKDIKGRIKNGCPKPDWIIKIINEEMGEKIVDKDNIINI